MSWWKAAAVAVNPILAVQYLAADAAGLVEPAGRVVKRGLGLEAPRVVPVVQEVYVQEPPPWLHLVTPWVIIAAGTAILARRK